MAFLEYQPRQTLYKYCSLDGFFGILESKRLWLTDLASANDPREIRLGYEKFIEALKSVRHNEYQGEKGFFLSILAGKLAPYHENIQAFCCCFSLAADELPMWGAYGDNYSGLAIGFRPTAIFGIPGRFQKVKYVDKNTDDDFRQLALDIAATLDANRNPSNQEYWISASVAAFTRITALKHTTWAYEREARLVHIQTIQPPDKNDDVKFSYTGLWPDGKPVTWNKPLGRKNGDSSVDYLEFPFGRFQNEAFNSSRAIEKVILGPNCPLSDDEVIAMMQKHDFENFEVNRSVCQIR